MWSGTERGWKKVCAYRRGSVGDSDLDLAGSTDEVEPLVVDVLEQGLINLLVDMCTETVPTSLEKLVNSGLILTEPMYGSFLPDVPEWASERR